MGRCREANLHFDDYDSSVEAAESLEESANLGATTTGDTYTAASGDRTDNAVS